MTLISQANRSVVIAKLRSCLSSSGLEAVTLTQRCDDSWSARSSGESEGCNAYERTLATQGFSRVLMKATFEAIDLVQGCFNRP